MPHVNWNPVCPRIQMHQNAQPATGTHSRALPLGPHSRLALEHLTKNAMDIATHKPFLVSRRTSLGDLDTKIHRLAQRERAFLQLLPQTLAFQEFRNQKMRSCSANGCIASTCLLWTI